MKNIRLNEVAFHFLFCFSIIHFANQLKFLKLSYNLRVEIKKMPKR